MVPTTGAPLITGRREHLLRVQYIVRHHLSTIWIDVVVESSWITPMYRLVFFAWNSVYDLSWWVVHIKFRSFSDHLSL